MRKASFVISACAGLVVATLAMGVAAADEPATPPKTGSTKPHLGNGPEMEKSLPSSAPAATTKHTTGASSQSKTVKAMNSNEKAKVEVGGK